VYLDWRLVRLGEVRVLVSWEKVTLQAGRRRCHFGPGEYNHIKHEQSTADCLTCYDIQVSNGDEGLLNGYRHFKTVLSTQFLSAVGRSAACHSKAKHGEADQVRLRHHHNRFARLAYM
jgi:hypothetical protein